MTEVATYEAPDDYAYDSPLVRWAREASAAHRIAQSLAKTSFVPLSFKKKGKDNWKTAEEVAAEVTAAILAGQEVGLRPMASLRSIAIINGTPAMTAIAMRALLQSHGHEVWIEGNPTDTKAVVKGKRRGSDRIHTSEWTIDRARKLDLTRKDNWTQQPMAMLIARATAEACRLTASDVLLGMPYAVEELQDMDAAPDAPAVSTPRRTLKRKPLTAVPAEPEVVEVEGVLSDEEAERIKAELEAERALDQGDDTDPTLEPFEPDVDPVEAS